MSTQTRDSETVKEIFAAINRGDVAAAMKFFDPDIERIEPVGFPSAGTYRGHAEVLEHLSKGRSTWAEGTCSPEDIIVAGDKVVVYLHVHVRLKNKTDWIDGRFADGFIFRNGFATQMRTFATREEAMTWLKQP